eukprot:1358974-Amorphochlora_amoeboformis.AAC.1
MNIPQTACIALSPLLPLPLGMGSAWLESFEANGEVIVPKKGERRRVASKLKSVRYVHRVLAVLRGIKLTHPRLPRHKSDGSFHADNVDGVYVVRILGNTVEPFLCPGLLSGSAHSDRPR